LVWVDGGERDGSLGDHRASGIGYRPFDCGAGPLRVRRHGKHSHQTKGYTTAYEQVRSCHNRRHRRAPFGKNVSPESVGPKPDSAFWEVWDKAVVCVKHFISFLIVISNFL